jgi:predicted amidohydrolase YtcJ
MEIKDMNRMKRFTILFSAVLLVLAGCTKQRPQADTIITNAKIYTVDARQPWAEAVAIQRERIFFVGTSVEALRHRGRTTRVIDAGGRLLLPGFEDSHVHFVSGSLNLAKVDLSGTKSVEEIQARIRQFAQEHPQSAWIQGRGWMYAAFPGNMPHKKYLDEVVPDRPAIMTCADGHTSWVNSRALALAGIDRNTPNPENGTIVREANGEPTGALLETADSLVDKVLPKPTLEETLAALHEGLREAARLGVVRVHGMGGEFEALDLLDRIRREGNLTLRFAVTMWVDPPGLTAEGWKAYEDANLKYNDEWIAMGGIKLMLDGVIDSMTGAMLDPYEGQVEAKGKLFWEPDAYKKTVVEINAKGIQVSTHSIGDAAIRLSLDAYEGGARVSGNPDLRDKIEHAEDISAADIPRFGRLGVIASFQPLHANPDPAWVGAWIKNVGPEREKRAWAWKSVLDGGGHLAFGSDWPVVTLNPWVGLQVAVTRQDMEGNPPGGWLPEQKLSLANAVYAYTMGGAFAMRREKDEGSIEAGKLADLILLSQNIFEIDAHKIAETKPVLTMVGGRIVFDTRAGEDLSLKDVVQKNIEASGGKEQIGQMKNLSFRTGDTRVVVAANGDLKLSTGKDPVVTEVILVKDGQVRRNSYNTITEFSDPEKTVYLTLARLYAGLFSLAKFEGNLKLDGLQSFGPEKLYHLSPAKPGAVEVGFFLRSDDFRLKRLVFQGKTTEGDIYEVNTDFGPFEAGEGYEMPRSWFTSQVGTRGNMAEVGEVKPNQPLPRDFFSDIKVNIGTTEAQPGRLKGNILDFNSNRFGLSVNTNWRKNDVEKAGLRTGDKLSFLVEGVESELVFYATSAEVPNPNESAQGLRVMTLPWFGETYVLQFIAVDTASITSLLKPLTPIDIRKKQ